MLKIATVIGFRGDAQGLIYRMKVIAIISTNIKPHAVGIGLANALNASPFTNSKSS